jgi:hypothetical protein
MAMTQRYNENSAAKHWILYAARMAMIKAVVWLKRI